MFYLIPLLLLSQKPVLLEGVSAVVGKKIVLVSEVTEKLTIQKTQICGIADSTQRLATFENLWKAALQDEINSVLMEIEAQNHNIYIGPEQIDRTIRMIVKQNRYDSLEQLKALLKEKNYPYLLWRKDIKRQLLVTELVSNVVTTRISVDDEAVKSFYLQKLRAVNAEEKVTLQEIFIKPEAYKKVKASLEKDLKDKTDFDLLIKKYGVRFKSTDGLRTDTTPGTYPPAIDRVLFGKKPAKKNEIIGPFVTEDGVLVLRIMERTESGFEKFEVVKDKLKKELEARMRQKKMAEWVKSLRTKHLVDIRITAPPISLLCK
ncbi:peptidyl-prolyl cis-trans isomerase [Myxococcota bacterium]|nr:peptidyl-prolyl cis-trans isomerase [Myxococcota bacterium]MBU1379391.1 peptidyl-prolyl cis-trans isomerase [Myxococcota bacterium]MBU1496793.1 peptidyl-prolyl cis-trans isomerase [Myxococcota bacterium]